MNTNIVPPDPIPEELVCAYEIAKEVLLKYLDDWRLEESETILDAMIMLLNVIKAWRDRPEIVLKGHSMSSVISTETEYLRMMANNVAMTKDFLTFASNIQDAAVESRLISGPIKLADDDDFKLRRLLR